MSFISTRMSHIWFRTRWCQSSSNQTNILFWFSSSSTRWSRATSRATQSCTLNSSTSISIAFVKRASQYAIATNIDSSSSTRTRILVSIDQTSISRSSQREKTLLTTWYTNKSIFCKNMTIEIKSLHIQTSTNQSSSTRLSTIWLSSIKSLLIKTHVYSQRRSLWLFIASSF